MANFVRNPTWVEGIRILEQSDPVLAGPDGPDNIAPGQLARRTEFLYDVLSGTFGQIKNDVTNSVASEIILPVSAGGIGLKTISRGNLIVGDENNRFTQVSPGELMTHLSAIKHYSEIPTRNVGPAIYVVGKGYMEWSTFGAWSGYARPDIGMPVFDSTVLARSYQADAMGGTGLKSRNPALWAWAGANGHIVGASSWRAGIYKFVDLGGDNFRYPDLRDMFLRATGTDADSANARELGSYQGDAMRRLYGSFAGVSYSTYRNQPGSHWFNDDPLFKRINDGDTGWTYPQVTIDAGQSTLQIRTTAIRFDTSAVSPTSTETRTVNTAFHLRLCAY